MKNAAIVVGFIMLAYLAVSNWALEGEVRRLNHNLKVAEQLADRVREQEQQQVKEHVRMYHQLQACRQAMGVHGPAIVQQSSDPSSPNVVAGNGSTVVIK